MSGTEVVVTAGGRQSASPGCAAVRAPAHDHVVQFYEQEESLYETVAAFLAEGLVAGERALVIATQAHRDGLRFRLSALGVDVQTVLRSGQLTVVDAQVMLMSFAPTGEPDAVLFNRHVGGLVEAIAEAHPGVRIRAFGEMVDFLWREGNEQAALRLEELWNELAARHSFALLCAYSMASFYREGQTAGFDAVCRQHGRVIPPKSDRLHLDAAIEVQDAALLRQRAHALQAEIDQRIQLEAALREALAER